MGNKKISEKMGALPKSALQSWVNETMSKNQQKVKLTEEKSIIETIKQNFA